ncbi:MAG: VOC family protein [Alphaproteobacteria bacterium]|nr:VOC family protein [Alphaproteobacteria bacterium]
MKTLLNRAKIIQNAYIVKDLEETIHRFHKIFGLGPFLLFEHWDLPKVTYRGDQEIDLDMSVAFVQSGELNLEFIYQHDNGPSAFRDMYGPGEEGFHHVALICDDYEQEVKNFEEAGLPVAMKFETGPDSSLVYVDTRSELGHMVELYQDAPGLHGLYDMIRSAAENWDGKELILTPSLG